MYDSNKDVTSAVDFDTFDSMTLLAILVPRLKFIYDNANFTNYYSKSMCDSMLFGFVGVIFTGCP